MIGKQWKYCFLSVVLTLYRYRCVKIIEKKRSAMPNFSESILGKKINGVRVVPLVRKIIVIFIVFLLVSNFSTNYINLMLNRGEMLDLANKLLVKDLKELYTFGMNQFEILQYTTNTQSAVSNIEQSAMGFLSGEKSLALGVRDDGTLLFESSHMDKLGQFTDEEELRIMSAALSDGVLEGTLRFRYGGGEYFGVYRYSDQWDAFFVRADELTEFNSGSTRIFRNVTLIIIAMSAVFVVIGMYLISFILRFVGIISSAIMAMQNNQNIGQLDLRGAPNDDVTFLGMAFNSLSSTIDNLMNIFKKFVARDLASRAYEEKEIRLEGDRKELVILFTDIKSFTFMTEMLGTDIIKLLNMHYDKAIRHIHDKDGDIGSIIGDALLAVFGIIEREGSNKSYSAIQAAYEIHAVAASLRDRMRNNREKIIRQKGSLSPAEERVYKAVLLEVGAGIDGGEVFYGTIGSHERMTNTVIGDNVNAASRLEGLTRVYKVPVIVSEYVKNEVEAQFNAYHFQELDLVQVKGKTVGRKIYWPIKRPDIDEDMKRQLDTYDKALKLYYNGDWPEASRLFGECTLPAAAVFQVRLRTGECPEDWNGIWTMNEK